MSKMNQPSIIIIDDFKKEVSDVIAHADALGFRTVFCNSVREAKEKWKEECGFDVAILDLNLETEGAGFEFVYATKESPGMSLPTVFIFSSFLEEFKVSVRLLRQVSRIYGYNKREFKEVEALKTALAEEYEKLTTSAGSKPVVASPQLKQLHDELPLIARSGLSVIVTGKTGSGKEHIARRIAEMSGRNSKLVRTVNCAAFAETLLMPELFGQVRGSFTGADAHRLGLLLEASGYEHDGTKGSTKEYPQWLSSKSRSKPEEAVAHNGEQCYALPKGIVGGTLILDEIAELHPTAQAALLRVLDGLPIKPVGYDGPGFLPNVRVIVATNDIETLSAKGAFRRDLLGRLNEWHIDLPPIEDRPDDARDIVSRTARDSECRISKASLTKACFEVNDSAMDAFLKKLGDLNGGIRELKSWTRRACIFAERDQQTIITEKHVHAAWERSFRVTDRSTGEVGEAGDAMDAGQLAAVKEDEIRKQLMGFMPALGTQFAFPDFIGAVAALDQTNKQQLAVFLRPLMDKVRSSAAQRREVFKALRYKGWDKASNEISEHELAKLPNRLSKAGLRNPFSRRPNVTGSASATGDRPPPRPS